MKKKLIAMLLSAAMCLSLAACGQKADTPDTTDPAEPSGDAATYTVGICQLVQHEALDAATQGFIDALNEALPGQVKIEEKNASGDSNSCATIVNGFVSEGVDLIMANATAALQAAASATSVKLVPVTGKYRITANLATRVIDALVLNADGSGLATLSDDGHGAVYFIGYGIGSPAAVNEPGWTTEKGVCVPESAPGIYTMTAQAGLEGSTTLGQRFRVSGWSGKFFRNRGWDGLGAFTLAPGAEAFFSIAGDGNIEIASGVTLEEGATYRLTLDVTAGKDNPVLSLVKK